MMGVLLTLQGQKVMQMMVGAPMGQQQQQASGSSKADSIKALPAPTEPAVRLAVAGGEIVAVMPFEGYITPEAAAAVRQKLVDALQAGEAPSVVSTCIHFSWHSGQWYQLASKPVPRTPRGPA
jgi:ABC-type sugar transport system ATPase subunit